jgi:NADH-quinone oxidoreductase subunit E
VVDHLKKKLGVSDFGEVTADGRFSIKEVECLGACVGAPMFQIGDHYHEHLTTEKIDAILTELE